MPHPRAHRPSPKPETLSSGTRFPLLRITGIVAIVVSLVVGGIGTWYLSRALSFKGWIPTTATVSTSRVRTKMASVGKQGSPQTNYQPVIYYNYKVNGMTYICDHYGYPPDFEFPVTDESTALRLADAYPVNSTVTAFYDPSNPRVAAIVRNINRKTIRYALFTFALIFPLGLYFTVAFAKDRPAVRRWAVGSVALQIALLATAAWFGTLLG